MKAEDRLVNNKWHAAIIVVLLTALIGAIPIASVLSSRVDHVEDYTKSHEIRLDAIESQIAAEVQSRRDVQRRLERIEIKLDALIERTPGG